MDNNDTKLLQLIQEAKNGNKSVYDEISNMIVDEVYNLVSFVYKKEETRKKLARHVVIKIIRSVNEFDSETMDIHMWIARFTTIEIYNVYSKQNGNIFNKTSNNLSYEYNSIDEDILFQNCAAQYNRAFIDIAELNKINGKLLSLTKAQKIIYEMFCYECFSIDEIEDVLEVDSTYIIDAIVGMKEQLCAYSTQESSDNFDNGVVMSEEEAYELNNIYHHQSKNSYSKYYKILSRFSKKSLISAACCAAVIVLAIVVFIVVSIKNKNSVSNVANYGQISTKQTTLNSQTTTITTTSTKKDNDQTTTQESKETDTDTQPTKNNSVNNQTTISKTQGNNTYVKPSSNVSNNPTKPSTEEPTVEEPTDNDPSQEPTDNDPTQEPTDNDPSQEPTEDEPDTDQSQEDDTNVINSVD